MLTKVVLPEYLQCCSGTLFEKCSNLKYITFPKHLQFIESNCFRYCGIEEIELPSSFESFYTHSFYLCSKLTKIDMSNATNLTCLESSTFKNCHKLKEIIFNDSIKKIDKKCFESCSELERITIPSSVTWISSKAFFDCPDLKELVILNDQCVLNKSIIYDSEKLTKFQIPTINGYATWNPNWLEKIIFQRNGYKIRTGLP